jgi:acyl phosphate:glycerol-3-phosphate acyltransferase
MEYLIAIIGGYLLGSIPFGLLLTKAAGLGDIRDIGSGNIGATNVLRTGNKALAAGTLLLDAGKAMLALVLVRHFHGEAAGFVAGAAAFLGHCFPVWLKFKGGKGVATFFGTVLVGAWPVGLIAAATWLLVAFFSRYSSLAGLVASAISAPVALLLGQPAVAGASLLFMTAILWLRHRENIERLLKGTEGRIGNKG